jgi:ethanolamine transporter EutH
MTGELALAMFVGLLVGGCLAAYVAGRLHKRFLEDASTHSK